MAMRMSASGAVKVAAKARKLQNLGKAWKVGDKGIVFYPIYKDPETGSMEILISAIWGYKVNDMKALGLKATFIPSNAKIGDDGKPEVPDITSQFARLAPAFIAGEKEAKAKALEGKPWPTSAAYKQALEKLEEEYDAKNNMKAKKPVVSRLTLYISTEVVYVPMVNDVPDYANARVYAQTLANTRISQLMAILKDPKYGIKDDSTYLEVQYDFVAADNEKATAGRAQPVGVTPEYSLKARFPDKAKELDNLLSQLPQDSDIIANHNYSYSKISENQLLSAFSNYAIMNSDSLDTVPADYQDSVIDSAKLITEMSVTKAIKDDELRQKIEERYAQLTPKDMQKVKETETDPNANGPVTIEQLVSNQARPDDDESEDLSDVTLD